MNCKKWREKQESDSIFIKDMFESLEDDLDYEKYKLWHKLQANLEYINKNSDINPPKDLRLEEFFIITKKIFTCDDPDCNCIELDSTE